MGGGSYGPSLKTYVFSRTLPPGDREGLTFINRDPNSFVGELRKHPGKDVWLMEVANSPATFSRKIWWTNCILGSSLFC